MDTQSMFLCTVVHPRLFPALPTDPDNPLRVEMLVEVGTEGLTIRAPAPHAKGKVMGSEPWTQMGRVTVERLGGSAQRQEILRRSLLRMALVGGIVLAWSVLFRSYPLHLSVLMALSVAAFVGPLNFLLNGGLGSKRDVVRFHFVPADGGRSFYLEVSPVVEARLQQALLAAGIGLEQGRRVW